MRKISFTKMVASGNDFVITEDRGQRTEDRGLKPLARQICNRRYGVGADGLLILGKSKIADIKMRIFNADGSEAEMCGNGARCIALYSIRSQKSEVRSQKRISIETRAGMIEARVNGENVKIRLTKPKDLKTDLPLRVNNRVLKVNFINTGVPHTVIFVEGLGKIDVLNLGKRIRYHKKFAPYGTNVDFVEILNNNSIKVRTYERGVEDETLACGTGAVASALVTTCNLQLATYNKIDVYTKSGEILKVHFNKIDNKFDDVWLEGKVKLVCKGACYV